MNSLELDRQQCLDVMLVERKADAVFVDVCDCRDRDRHLAAAKQVALADRPWY